MKNRKLKPCQTRRRASVRNLKRSMKEIVAKYVEMAREASKDHAAYFKAFMDSWSWTITNLAIEADAFMLHPRVRIPEEDRAALGRLYSWMPLTHFSFLMDNLSFEEEAELRTAAFNLDQAWERLLSTIRSQHPATAARTEEVRHYQQAVQKIVVDMYLGEEPGGFSHEWSMAYQGFTASFAALSLEVLND